MRSLFITLFVVCALGHQADAKAYFQTKSEMIEKAEVIAIITISLIGLPFALAAEEAPALIEINEVLAPKPDTEAIPKAYANEKAVCLKLEGSEANGRNAQTLKMRLINPTDQPLVFTGFSAQSPLTKIQKWEDGKWVDHQQFLRCGTGLRPCTIAAGQAALISVYVQSEISPARVGVSYANEQGKAPDKVVWSDKIEDVEKVDNAPELRKPIRLIDKR